MDIGEGKVFYLPNLLTRIGSFFLYFSVKGQYLLLIPYLPVFAVIHLPDLCQN